MTPRTVSRPLAEMENLSAVAKQHVEHCPGESCAVSLFLLKQTAERLAMFLPSSEWLDGRKVLESWPGV